MVCDLIKHYYSVFIIMRINFLYFISYIYFVLLQNMLYLLIFITGLLQFWHKKLIRTTINILL